MKIGKTILKFFWDRQHQSLFYTLEIDVFFILAAVNSFLVWDENYQIWEQSFLCAFVYVMTLFTRICLFASSIIKMRDRIRLGQPVDVKVVAS